VSKILLKEADKLEITILVDNYTDLLVQGTEVVRRPVISVPDAPLAEHGFSCLVKVTSKSEEHLVIMDAGMTSITLLYNMRILGIDINKVEAIILSHGHVDHYGGIIAFLDKTRNGLPVVLHPDAFLERRINNPKTGHRPSFKLEECTLEERGAVVCKRQDSSTLASDNILVTGEVERITDFEKGFPYAQAKIAGKWLTDPFLDDQGIAVNVKGKGLVVIGGCSHAGIINTVRYAQKVTGCNKVYAVIGGFHLAGPLFEQIIMPTIEEMKKIGPDTVVPTHCTGWQAMNLFAQEMPDQFVLNTVGTTYVF
jgi:7,8-dihydropterin-6-yl-methyl-4-(beta-D-ribofuranosyl)aminobenzene 5'-phosphate synthase